MAKETPKIGIPKNFCGNCAYWHPEQEGGRKIAEWGECRKNPPQVVAVIDAVEGAQPWMTAWPQVERIERACGLWSRS